jgi:hypothetical protein
VLTHQVTYGAVSRRAPRMFGGKREIPRPPLHIGEATPSPVEVLAAEARPVAVRGISDGRSSRVRSNDLSAFLGQEPIGHSSRYAPSMQGGFKFPVGAGCR